MNRGQLTAVELAKVQVEHDSLFQFFCAEIMLSFDVKLFE